MYDDNLVNKFHYQVKKKVKGKWVNQQASRPHRYFWFYSDELKIQGSFFKKL